MSANDDLISDCLNSAVHGIQQAVAVNNIAKSISIEIQSKNKENQQLWPPTPQDIMKECDIEMGNKNLYNLLAWIVSPSSTYDDHGVVKLSETKATKVTKICADIESLIPNAMPSLSHVLLSLNVYRKTGSSNIISDLHKLGHGLSYTATKFIEDKWAEWTERQSSLIPCNIHKGMAVTTLVFDNIDWKNNDLRGKETHNTNSILIQQNFESVSNTKVDLTPDYNYDRKAHRSFKGFKSQLEPVRFERASCKELTYENTDQPEYLEATKRNTSWIISHYNSSKETLQTIPSWRVFQQILAEGTIKANVGYLPPVTDPPSEMSVIFAFINRALRIFEELEINQMFLEVDQAIYTKVLDAMFNMEADGINLFSKLVPRIGGFHVFLCMLRTMFARFKDSGIIQWLVYSGIDGEGTISRALSGDVKHGNYINKLMFEAIMRSKICYLVENGLFTINNDLQQRFECLQGNISAENFAGVCNEVQLLTELKEGMPLSLELYLDMANLLLNTIYFQRTGNWEGYLQSIHEFIAYCFALNRHNYARNLSYYYVHMLNLEKS